MRLAIVAAVVLALAGTASAATTRRVPADYANIQAAEDACVDGDTIQVAKGRYILDSTVNFDVPNIKVIGSGAIIDGARPNLNNVNIDCFNVSAAGITISGFKFVNGDNQIYSNGANLTISKCTFVDSSGSSIYLNSGNGAIVTGCKILGSGDSAVEAYVNNGQFLKNTVRSTDSYGIYVEGSGSRFEGNTLNFIEDSSAIYNSTGANAVVLKNKIFNTDGDAVTIYGNDVTVEGNTVKKIDADTAIYVDGTSALVKKNKINDVGAGVEVYGDGAEILANKIVDIHGYTGIECEADNMTVIGNSATLGSDDAYGFYLYSRTAAGTGLVEKNSTSEMIDAGFYLGSGFFNNVVVRNCSVKNCGAEDEAGFWVENSNNSEFEGLKVQGMENTGIYHQSGNNNTYTKCAVKDVFGDGYRVYGDNNDFTDCTAANCGGEGFDNRGTNTDLIGGKYRGDRNDVANDTANAATITLTDVDKSTPGTPQSQVD